MVTSSLSLTADYQSPGTPFRHSWSGLGNVDQFRWLVRADLRQHLKLAKETLGLRHVRACAMFSPEMKVWGRKLSEWKLPAAQRTTGPNWQIIDYCIEGLLELGLKPIYTTCFTPEGFTDGPETCWPDRNRIRSPRNLKDWQDFVSASIRHHIDRYGLEEVRSWYFECWNEPNLNGFFAGSQEEFFRLWSATWHAVKAIDPALRFGGPSTARGEWISEFLDWTTADGTPPDYLITHVYNNDSESTPLSPFDGPASHRVKDSPHFATGVIKGLRTQLDQRGWKGEVHWNEWGRSWFPFDPQKETSLESAFIVKTMAEASQQADHFAFWCLSDIYDQCGYQDSEFNANYGMLSLHGLRKPAWQAHVLLEQLGDSRLPLAGGSDLTNAIVTRHGNRTATLVYSYPDNTQNPRETVDIQLNVPASITNPQLIRLGAEENNIVATWNKMGSPAYPTPSQLQTLHAANDLVTAPSTDLRIKNGLATFTMEKPGVALFTFES